MSPPYVLTLSLELAKQFDSAKSQPDEQTK